MMQKYLGGGGTGGEIVTGLRSRRELQEAATREGAEAQRLRRINLNEETGQLEFAQPLEKTGFEKEFRVGTSKIGDIMGGLRSQVQLDPNDFQEVLGVAEREFMSEAMKLKKGIQTIPGVGKGRGREVYIKLVREFQSEVQVLFLNRIRDLEQVVDKMRASGEDIANPQKFMDTLTQLGELTKGLTAYQQGTLATRGAGRGTVISNLASLTGEVSPLAREAGILPTPSMLNEQIRGIAGEGEEGIAFAKQMGTAIDFATGEIKEGKGLTEAWSAIWESLLEKPSLSFTRLTNG